MNEYSTPKAINKSWGVLSDFLAQSHKKIACLFSGSPLPPSSRSVGHGQADAAAKVGGHTLPANPSNLPCFPPKSTSYLLMEQHLLPTEPFNTVQGQGGSFHLSSPGQQYFYCQPQIW